MAAIVIKIEIEMLESCTVLERGPGGGGGGEAACQKFDHADKQTEIYQQTPKCGFTPNVITVL